MAIESLAQSPIFTPNYARAIVERWLTCPIDNWRKQQQQARFYTATVPRHQTHALTNQAVKSLIAELTRRGYAAAETRHKCPFDLLVNDSLRLEVKAANWTPRHGRPQFGRYQANVKRHQIDICDVLVFAIRGAVAWPWQFFIVPAQAVTGRTIEITSYDVGDYTGKYARFLGAWGIIADCESAAKSRTRQLSFCDNGGLL